MPHKDHVARYAWLGSRRGRFKTRHRRVARTNPAAPDVYLEAMAEPAMLTPPTQVTDSGEPCAHEKEKKRTYPPITEDKLHFLARVMPVAASIALIDEASPTAGADAAINDKSASGVETFASLLGEVHAMLQSIAKEMAIVNRRTETIQSLLFAAGNDDDEEEDNSYIE